MFQPAAGAPSSEQTLEVGVDRLDLTLLDRACRLMNEWMWRFTLRSDTCIASAASLRDVLLKLGYEAEVLRVSPDVFPPANQRSPGVFLGDAAGEARRGTRPGYWKGHLVVSPRR